MTLRIIPLFVTEGKGKNNDLVARGVKKKMRVLFAASEVEPFAKTGGLADVAGSLPPALERLGHDVKIIMPKYGMISEVEWGLKRLKEFTVPMGEKNHRITLWNGMLPNSSLEVYFLSTPFFSRRDAPYQENGKDYPDNPEAFALFCKALLEVPKLQNWHPDILHFNDWQTALALAYRKADLARDPFYLMTGTLFTIHNLAFQGVFQKSVFPILGLPESYFTSDTLEFYGKINFLKSGIVFADLLNTVSPTYSKEILEPEFGCGLEGLIRQRQDDLYGILNGADYQKWNPANDRSLSRGYSPKSMEGKRVCKNSLQRKCKFPEKDVLLIGIVSRLTHQKGMALVLEVIEELTSLNLQMVVLGVGEPELEAQFKKASEKCRDKLSVHLTFDDKFSHRVMAGSDLFLMPSIFEPCGLSQIYALRYGAIPLVRKTGGLADTIMDATPKNLMRHAANGFQFETASSHSLLTALRLALSYYQDRPNWNNLVQTAMSADFSWDRSAKEYEKLYQIALAKLKSSA
ncbi:MAG: glycogen synthase GlgA [Nitrospirae bacterium]|nr:glycogen synthase GlgA [Nitrospirota bacterium]MBI3593357.1 glycogen synthase GlgA [Nitrospirota bacterium]